MLGASARSLHAPSRARLRVLAAIADPGVDDRDADRDREGLPARTSPTIARAAGRGRSRARSDAGDRPRRSTTCRATARCSLVAARERAGGRAPRSRARWSTASCPPRRTRTGPPSRAPLGFEDRGAVVAEPFRQWVIEDLRRPAARRGTRCFVASSAPARGAQAAAAQRHPLAARRRRASCSVRARSPRRGSDEDLVAAALRLADEDLVPTLPPVPGIDVADYRAQLARRWANPGIEHRLAQIALDGPQKLPVRFAEPARERIAAGRPPRWIALGARRVHRGRRRTVDPRRVPACCWRSTSTTGSNASRRPAGRARRYATSWGEAAT